MDLFLYLLLFESRWLFSCFFLIIDLEYEKLFKKQIFRIFALSVLLI